MTGPFLSCCLPVLAMVTSRPVVPLWENLAPAWPTCTCRVGQARVWFESQINLACLVTCLYQIAKSHASLIRETLAICQLIERAVYSTLLISNKVNKLCTFCQAIWQINYPSGLELDYSFLFDLLWSCDVQTQACPGRVTLAPWSWRKLKSGSCSCKISTLSLSRGVKWETSSLHVKILRARRKNKKIPAIALPIWFYGFQAQDKPTWGG